MLEKVSQQGMVLLSDLGEFCLFWNAFLVLMLYFLMKAPTHALHGTSKSWNSNMQICLANGLVSLHHPTAVGTQSGCAASCEVMPESQGNSGDHKEIEYDLNCLVLQNLEGRWGGLEVKYSSRLCAVLGSSACMGKLLFRGRERGRFYLLTV